MADADKPPQKQAHLYAGRGSRIYRWFDRRTGLGSLMHEALDEPIPGGARWAYVFGSVANGRARRDSDVDVETRSLTWPQRFFGERRAPHKARQINIGYNP